MTLTDPKHRLFLAPILLLALNANAQQNTPVITSIAGGVGNSPATTAVAPGEIVTITGANLAQASANMAGTQVPTSMGGVQVSIGGKAAPLFMVSPTQIVAQVPFEVLLGSQFLTVMSGTVTSDAWITNVAAVAPAWFADMSGAIVVKASDNSLIGASNPAQPGDILLIYATGLGQTTPSIATGALAPTTSLANTTPVTVSIGGQTASPVYSVAAPGFAGLSQIAIRVPNGLAGTVPVTLQSGATVSAAANIITGVRKGAQIDPQIQAVSMQLQALGPKPIQTLTPAEARVQPSFADAVKSLQQAQGKSPAPQAVASTQDIMVPGGVGMIPARVYTPQGTGPFPVIVFFHGGGFVIATIDTYDASARALANAVGAVVLSVEYRKAPENPFPAAPEDAYASVQWVMNNAASIGGRADRVAVDGESAGGNLATVVCMMARDRGGKMPAYQVLVYPVTNLASESPAYEENGNAPFLTRAALRWFGGYYFVKKTDALNPYASPLLGNLQGLPPATVITEGFDPLRDEGAGYADKLRQAGVSVMYRNFESATHEFFGMGAVVDVSNQAVQYVAQNLKAAFGQ
ncbi:MAG: alpha/beta hydrolase fold domain-containing protein [Acidobacteriota bacterium]|nr:alpha/beta hydrolase fold domain-containing protein [Acidobacteriota bacterium]